MKMQKLNQEQVWDEIAEPWEKFRKKKPVKEILQFLKSKKGKILDIGCGSGRHFLKLDSAKLYGIDSSKHMLKLAKNCLKKKRIKGILKKSSADKLPFKKNFFDAAIFAATLHCLDSKKKRKKALQEMFRVLKPEGEAIISVWSRKQGRVKNKPKESFIPWTINGKKYWRYYYLYDKRELESLLRETGFKILKSWENEHIFMIVKPEK